jgi:protein-L-isoaspartate(D-aspartate) O-methyltransferase
MRGRVSAFRRLIFPALVLFGWIGLLTAGFASVCARTTQEDERNYQEQRESMVREQIAGRGIKNKRVLEAFRRVPRHHFVPKSLRALAYSDQPLPIGERQTISQPEIVAMMTEAIKPEKTMRVLEIGTGSGYQAAILAECVLHVDSIEVLPSLGKSAAKTLEERGYKNVEVRIGDGYEGWVERAPYDAIILTAAPPHEIPQPLLSQLKIGGTLVAPVGRSEQKLIRITRTATGYERKVLASVRFVPMTGKAQEKSRP